MIAWMFEGLVASTLLMAAVMLLRRPVAHMLGARIAYLLWALPALRLLLPPLPRAGAAEAVLPPSAVEGAGDYVIIYATGRAGSVDAPAFPWLEAAIMLWIAGAVLFCAIETVAYLRFRRLMLSDARLLDRRENVAIVESVHARGPLAFGVLRRYVVLPVDFADRYSAEERAMAIAHELAHHRRGDLAANLVALMVLTLHWWNPIAWIAYRAFRADQELACDAHVLARHGAAHAQAYGRAILKAASGRHFAAACHLNTIDNLKGRLKMLSTHHSNSLHRISWGMTAVAAVTVAGLALTASGGRAAREMASVSDTLDNAHMAKLAGFLPPAAPPAPAAPASPAVMETLDRIEAPKPPEAPRAPEAPAAAHRVKKIIIMSEDGKTREHVIAMPAPPAPPVPPVPPSAFAGKGQRIVVRTRDGKTITQDVTIDGDQIVRGIPEIHVDERCDTGRSSVSTQTSEVNGEARQVRVMICGKGIAGEARAQALAGLRRARAEMQRETDLSEATRARILADLDREIARMKADRD
jgi:bla regulator protein BlaR1